MRNCGNELMVTIRCLAYNHEAYIRQCLDGFVMQRTSFRFEAIVHDDASTDGTAGIIREYAERYPDIIKPIFETENQYSKHDGSIRRIMNQHTRGKYVAMCEGDDYWIDPLKLQKQVDLLESNKEYSMCFHNAIEHWSDRQKNDTCFSHIVDREYSGLEIYKNWIIPTASVVFKKSILKSNLASCFLDPHFLYGDILFFLLAASCGKIVGMKDVMSVYRRHEGGAVFGYNVKRMIRSLEHHKQIPKVFGEQYKMVSEEVRIPLLISISFHYLKHGSCFLSMKYLKLSLEISPKRTMIYIYKKIRNKP